MNLNGKEMAQQAIHTNISCMRKLLETALVAMVQAEQEIEKKERNGAIGSILHIEPVLQNTKALFDATIFLHQQGL